MAREITDAAAVGDVPESDGAIGGSRRDVVDVGVEGHHVDI